MPDILIRQVRWADLTPLCDMIAALAAFHGDHATIDVATLNRDIFGTTPWVRVSIAEVDDQIVGYAALSPLTKLQFGERGMDMHHIFVRHDHRNSGVGRHLIADAIERSKALGCSYLMVGTAPGNTAAQSAYLACGFLRHPRDPDRFHMRLS